MAIRVAHIWSSDMGAAGGLPHMRPFLAAGHEITVIAPDGPRLDAVRAAGMACLPITLSRRMDPASDLRTLAELVAHCRRQRFDLVHTHNIKTGVLGRLAAALTRAPRLVHTLHGIPFDRETPARSRLPHLAVEWAACRVVDRVLVQSRADEATMLAGRVIARDKLVRIGNGIALDRFAPERTDRAAARAALGLAASDVAFLSAGRLIVEKGYRELIAAAASARQRDPRLRLFLAGPVDEARDDCLSPADLDAARAAGVVLLGERRDMPALLAAADVCVLPSWREGLPRFLMEAAALGKPLLATDVRGCREVVSAPDGGWLVPPRDPRALADAMVAIAAEPAARASIGAANRARALAEFDIEAVVRRIAAVYRELGV
jgi:glycosyltransferase involved in cell wall biosynthesis